MAKVPPYHSSLPLDPQVFHDHDDCPIGSRIAEKNLEPGDEGFRRCEECKNLDG